MTWDSLYSAGEAVDIYYYNVKASLPFLHSDATQHPWLRHVGHVDEDIIGGVAVQRRAKALLIEVVTDEAD